MKLSLLPFLMKSGLEHIWVQPEFFIFESILLAITVIFVSMMQNVLWIDSVHGLIKAEKRSVLLLLKQKQVNISLFLSVAKGGSKHQWFLNYM